MMVWLDLLISALFLYISLLFLPLAFLSPEWLFSSVLYPHSIRAVYCLWAVLSFGGIVIYLS